MNEKLIDQVNQLLPQTQCGLCEYPACRPYAEAVVKQEAPINRCLPGGVETLMALAECLHKDATEYVSEMKEKSRPPARAIIREEECIGCTKCIQACPTDAIIGASKLMHTIISDACTGCERCLPPCPVDCIDIKPLPLPSDAEKKHRAEYWRKRYEHREARLIRCETETSPLHNSCQSLNQTREARTAAIQAALERVRIKRKSRS